MHCVASIVNSPALVPVVVMTMPVIVALLLLVSVTVCVGLMVPTG